MDVATRKELSRAQDDEKKQYYSFCAALSPTASASLLDVRKGCGPRCQDREEVWQTRNRLGCRALAFSPDGKRLMREAGFGRRQSVGRADRKASAWIGRPCRWHGGRAFHRRRHALVDLCGGYVVYDWKTNGPCSANLAMPNAYSTRHAALSPDGAWAGCRSGKGDRHSRCESRKTDTALRCRSVAGLAYCPDSQQIVLAAKDTIRLCDAVSGKETRRMTDPLGMVRHLTGFRFAEWPLAGVDLLAGPAETQGHELGPLGSRHRTNGPSYPIAGSTCFDLGFLTKQRNGCRGRDPTPLRRAISPR